MECHCESKRSARDTQSVTPPLLCQQKRDRDARKTAHLFFMCIPRNLCETASVLTTNLNQGDKVWVKKSLEKKTNRKSSRGGRSSCGFCNHTPKLSTAFQLHEMHFPSHLTKFSFTAGDCLSTRSAQEGIDAFALAAEHKLRFTFRNETWWKRFSRPHLL